MTHLIMTVSKFPASVAATMVEHIFAMADFDRSGALDFDEFRNALQTSVFTLPNLFFADLPSMPRGRNGGPRNGRRDDGRGGGGGRRDDAPFAVWRQTW